MSKNTKKYSGLPAKIQYEKSSYRITVSGEYVKCAITNKPIPIDKLCYWSHKKQEPYIDAKAAIKAKQQQKKKKK